MKHDSWFYCTLNFYYHMMGATVGTLNVYVETPDDNDLGVSLDFIVTRFSCRALVFNKLWADLMYYRADGYP